jgi:hypothetical protein
MNTDELLKWLDVLEDDIGTWGPISITKKEDAEALAALRALISRSSAIDELVEAAKKHRSIPVDSVRGMFDAALMAVKMGGCPEGPMITILNSWGIVVGTQEDDLRAALAKMEEDRGTGRAPNGDPDTIVPAPAPYLSPLGHAESLRDFFAEAMKGKQ